MPDGDIFQRKLAGAGKGWVSIFRLLDKDPDRGDLGTRLLTASRCNLDELPKNYILEAFGYLDNALSTEVLLATGNSKTQLDAYMKLDTRMRVLDYGEAFGVAQIVKDSILSVFNANRMLRGKLSTGEIVEKFSSTFQDKLLDSRFSRLRHELQSSHGRSNVEQEAWERKVKRQTGDDMCKMIQRYLTGGGIRFRVPPRRRRAAPSMGELLSRPIRLIER